MTDYNDIDPYNDEGGYVLNRARLYRDRPDFVIQPGDTGSPQDYPVSPAHPSRGSSVGQELHLVGTPIRVWTAEIT